MTCERCAGQGFELVGVEPGGVVCLRCGRCGRVERVVADRRPPQQRTTTPSRYRERGELLEVQHPAAPPA